MPDYLAPAWLPGGHAQTIWPALFSKPPRLERPRYRRERWDTPDGDFIDVDFALAPAFQLVASLATLAGPIAAPTVATPAITASRAEPASSPTSSRPLLVLFHGLEGSSQSHYALAFAAAAASMGFAYAVVHFRGCSGEINRAPRAYHSGDHAEIDWVLRRFRQRHSGPLWAVGVSLGGNALLRWAGEMGDAARQQVDAIAAVCAPLDLAAGGAALGQGLNRQVYTRMFLHSMKPRALARLALHPGLFDRRRLLAARTLYEFDNVFTAPLHGFQNTDDYWARASAKPYLGAVRVPAWVVNALNDPFVPAASLPRADQVSSDVELWQPAHGGHVGFAAGAWPGHLRALPERVLAFFQVAGVPLGMGVSALHDAPSAHAAPSGVDSNAQDGRFERHP